MLFIGDSITCCDKDPNNPNSIGFGYVRLIDALLTIREPEKNIILINKGVNGNTLGHLLSRWGDDVYEHNPDILLIMIGINDAVRLLDKSTSYHLVPEEFKKTYCQLLEETRRTLPKTHIMLMEPFFLSRGQNPTASYRNKLKKLVNEYVTIVDEMSTMFNTSLVPLASRFDKIIQQKPSSFFSEDWIHPNQTGHLFIAETIYDTLRIHSQQPYVSG